MVKLCKGRRSKKLQKRKRKENNIKSMNVSKLEKNMKEIDAENKRHNKNFRRIYKKLKILYMNTFIIFYLITIISIPFLKFMNPVE